MDRVHGGTEYTNVHDGRIGLAFIDASVNSQKNNNAWTQIDIS